MSWPVGRPAHNRGTRMSDAQRAKISASHVGIRPSAKTRSKMSVAHLGRAPTRGFTGKRHSATTRAKIGAAGKGRCPSDETIAKMRVAAVGYRRSEESIVKQMSHPFWHGHGRGSTSLERNLYVLLEGAGYQVERQVRFGRYVVDAWLPEQCLVFEADGMFWYHHQDADREARRDAYLLAHGAVAVVHLTDEDLK